MLFEIKTLPIMFKLNTLIFFQSFHIQIKENDDIKQTKDKKLKRTSCFMALIKQKKEYKKIEHKWHWFINRSY